MVAQKEEFEKDLEDERSFVEKHPFITGTVAIIILVIFYLLLFAPTQPGSRTLTIRTWLQDNLIIAIPVIIILAIIILAYKKMEKQREFRSVDQIIKEFRQFRADLFGEDEGLIAKRNIGVKEYPRNSNEYYVYTVFYDIYAYKPDFPTVNKFTQKMFDQMDPLLSNMLRDSIDRLRAQQTEVVKSGTFS